MPPTRVDAAVARSLVSSVQHILLDVDGVVWSGAHVLPRIPETLTYLRAAGKRVCFVSNNASLSRRELCNEFAARGIAGVTEGEVCNSAYAAALQLQQMLGQPTDDNNDDNEAVAGGDGNSAEQQQRRRLVHGNVFVIGEQGLHEELRAVLAPGYITYGLELHDMARAGGYSSSRLAHAWHAPTLPAPQQRLVVCDPHTASCRMLQARQATDKKAKSNNHSEGGGGNSNTDGDDDDDETACMSLSDLNAVAVVVGLDLHFNMLKLACATLILRGPPQKTTNTSTTSATSTAQQSLSSSPPHATTTTTTPALFIATNTDPQIPVGADNLLVPGAGALVQSLCVAAGRAAPDAMCGKPNPAMAQLLFARDGVTQPRTQCLMVGDRLTTDVAFGSRAQCATMLVLSGAETAEDVRRAEEVQAHELVPDYVADSLASLLPPAPSSS